MLEASHEQKANQLNKNNISQKLVESNWYTEK